ncbi:Amino acid permease [Candidatus Gugararchaeum adminiculabundum]|nr:Amino acid permease [Candidatus Gugararchaeum adminiculabundum]
MKCEQTQEVHLKRGMGLLGSFSIGFADVGADLFLTLGLISAYAAGARPLAILIAALVYACTGYAYAELASAMPVAGGASSYGRRAFSPFVGFLGGWGLILDYTIDISLFAYAAVGYLTFFMPFLRETFSVAVAVLIVLLALINMLGIKESSRFNTMLTMFTILIVSCFIAFAFSTKFDTNVFISTIKPLQEDPGVHNFLYAITIAMVTFIGIESISQAAEETKDPGKIIPRATGLAIYVVIIFALVASVMVLGIISPQELSKPENIDNPMTAVAKKLPFTNILVPIIAFAGALICTVSANTGVIGSSRVVYALSKNGMISRRLCWLHPKYRTPWVSIILFSSLAIVLVFGGDLVFLAELYAFGALIAYLIGNASVISLRIREPNLFRPYKVPFNIKIKGYDIPLISIVGVISCSAVFALVALLHEQGRTFAFLWMVCGIIMYFSYKYYKQRIPEIENMFLEDKTHESTILVPLRLVHFEEDSLDMIANVSKQNGLPVTLLHIIELPPTVPLDQSLITLGPTKQKELFTMRSMLEARGARVRIALRNSRDAVCGIMDFIDEKGKDVKFIFMLQHSEESKTIRELEDKCSIQIMTYNPQL